MAAVTREGEAKIPFARVSITPGKTPPVVSATDL